MKKKWIIMLSMFLMLGSMTTAQAEEYEGESGWIVQFTGSGIESNFKTADINDAVYNLQPGDSVRISMALRNNAEGDTDWWMTNQVLRSLEDTQRVASNGGYSYTLVYRHPEGTDEILYSSETVGGEKEADAGEGLHEAADSLSEFFYLDNLSTKEQGELLLTVALDGETQGNAYQDTLADLTLNFAVEEADAPETPEEREERVRQPGAPKTGDESQLMLFVILTLLSGVGLLVLALLSQREGETERAGGKRDEK